VAMEVNETKLLPCPFCGNERGLYTMRTKYAGDVVDRRICCPNCDANGPSSDSDAEAGDQWNRRKAGEQAP